MKNNQKIQTITILIENILYGGTTIRSQSMITMCAITPQVFRVCKALEHRIDEARVSKILQAWQ